MGPSERRTAGSIRAGLRPLDGAGGAALARSDRTHPWSFRRPEDQGETKMTDKKRETRIAEIEQIIIRGSS